MCDRSTPSAGIGIVGSVCEEALAIECELENLHVGRQIKLPVEYRGRLIGTYCLDVLINELAVVEIKSVERFDPAFEAQVLTYLKITGKRVGLLINFNARLVKDGIKRYIL